MVQAHKAKGVAYGQQRGQLWATKGLVPWMQRDITTTEPDGGGHVRL